MIASADDLCCRELVELVTDYLDGALPRPIRARFERHLASCPSCRDYLEQLRATARLAGGLTGAALPPGVRDALLAAFRGWKSAGGRA